MKRVTDVAVQGDTHTAMGTVAGSDGDTYSLHV